LKSVRQSPWPKGIIAQPNRLSTKVAIGAIKNSTLFACVGTTFSLSINFKASANGCNTPQYPVTCGPTLRWCAANCLRSIIVINATANNIGTIITKTFAKFKIVIKLFIVYLYFLNEF